MKLRALSSEEIRFLSSRKGVDAKLINSFVSSIAGLDCLEALNRLESSSDSNNWNTATKATLTVAILKASKRAT